MALTDNIVAYWKLDQASGDAPDATGNGFTLTNTNSVAVVSGLINNGADLGSNYTNHRSYSITNNLGIDGTSISISCWLKVQVEATSPGYFFTQCSNVSGIEYRLRYTGNAGTNLLEYSRLKAPSTAATITSVTTLSTNTWYHTVLTYDGTNLNAYFNGSALSGTTQTGNGTTAIVVTRTSIGGNVQGNSWLPCQMDEVGVWSRALSAGEVTSLYNGGAGIQYPFVASASTQPSFFLNFIT